MPWITEKQYLADPCRVSSVPYWKAVTVTVPANMRIVHHEYFQESLLEAFTDEPYFRLFHDLTHLTPAVLPEGFSLCSASLEKIAEHINGCYDDIGISEAELSDYLARPVYDAALWLAVRDDRTGRLAATGIGELDREIGEGTLEWIQVSKEYRGRGLGSYLVRELLWRMGKKARFATVSGRCNNATDPERLYRKCGFSGNDVWHVLNKR